MNEKKWIWQHTNFPLFTYDYGQIEPMIFQLIEKSGELKGKMSYLATSERDTFSVDTSASEIIATSLIEGVELRRESVRSSLQKKLDISFNRTQDSSTKNSDSLTELYLDSRFNQEALSIERLHTWHRAVFEEYDSVLYPVNKGVFREHDDMQIVSGSIGRETVHYQAIPRKEIESSMQQLIDYINTHAENFIVKSAVAHLWFESIHPYDDGNGRIGRAIVNYILSKDGGLDNRYYSVSSAINEDRQGYYNALEKAQNLLYTPDLEITEWIQWHTKSIERSIDISLHNIEKVVAKTRFYDKIRYLKLNEKQNKVINKLLEIGEGNFEGGLTNKKYRSLTKTDAVTASRHLKDMVNKGVIREIEGFSGRNTRYELHFH